MWKLNNGYLPESLVKNFRTNKRTKFSKSNSRLESLNKYILFAGPQLWKELPSEITKKPSLDSFSTSLKKYLIHGTIINSNIRNINNINNNRRNNNNHDSQLGNNRRPNRPFVSRWDQ